MPNEAVEKTVEGLKANVREYLKGSFVALTREAACGRLLQLPKVCFEASEIRIHTLVVLRICRTSAVALFRPAKTPLIRTSPTLPTLNSQGRF